MCVRCYDKFLSPAYIHVWTIPNWKINIFNFTDVCSFYLRPWPYPYIKWSVGCNRQSIHFSIHCRLVLWNKYVASNGGVKDSQPPLVPARANWYPPQWRRKSEVSANGGHFWVSPQPPERAGQQDICGTALLVLANPQTDFSFWFCGFNGRFTGS